MSGKNPAGMMDGRLHLGLENFLMNELGKKVYPGYYVAIDGNQTIIAAAYSKMLTKELAHTRGVHAPRIMPVSHIRTERFDQGLCIGSNMMSGKIILDKKYYARLFGKYD
jgi:hypothetical protein